MRKAILILVLISMVSTASADKLFRSDRFEFYTPDNWHCETAEGDYIKAARKERTRTVESFSVRELVTDHWPEAPEEIADLIREETGQSFEEWEELEIDGQKTVIIFRTGPMNSIIAQSTLNAGECHASILYISVNGNGSKENFLNILKTMAVRGQNSATPSE